MDRDNATRAFAAMRAGVYAVGFVLLWAWIATLVRRFDRVVPLEIAPWLRPLGIALATLGALLTLRCVVVFVTRGLGTPAPFDAPRAFVASAPHRWVRNPMYIGAAPVERWLR